MDSRHRTELLTLKPTVYLRQCTGRKREIPGGNIQLDLGLAWGKRSKEQRSGIFTCSDLRIIKIKRKIILSFSIHFLRPYNNLIHITGTLGGILFVEKLVR